MQDIIINKNIKNEYIIGTIELQALKKLYKSNLITEDNYKLLKNKIIKEYHIFLWNDLRNTKKRVKIRTGKVQLDWRSYCK